MNKNNEEKSLIKVNENSIFYKIKNFFRNLFKKENSNEVREIINVQANHNIQKEKFNQYIKNIEDDETRLLKLQKQYRNGEIKESELTQTQYKLLCDLYDKQILELKKSNEARKQKILQYRSKLHYNG